MVNLLSEEWRKLGLRVTVATEGRLTGDLGIVNFDRTKVDPSDMPMNPLGRPLLNEGFLDISKRRISRHLVQRGDGYQGPVIVKTDLNHFGRPERDSGQPGLRARLGKALSRVLARRLPRGAYPIYARPELVPGWVWRDPSLVVERFLCEREGDLYVLRMWVFFGSGEYTLKFFSRRPVVKFAEVVRHEFTEEPVPQELRAFRRLLKADFGKFDFTMRDGRAHLLDANKTPVLADVLRGTPELSRVARGIRDWAPALLE